MEYFDLAISLGQYCITSTALRRLNLQDLSMVFDWSAGILPEKCGLGGLEGKVNLICNDFQDFFNFEDFENRGNNESNDTYNLWIVNKRTGLQYRHDFNAKIGFEKQFSQVKEKYLNRVNRLYSRIAKANKVLFVYMARDTGFTNEHLIKQQEKLAKKFPDKHIHFLYVMHDDKFTPKEYEEFDLTPNIRCIYCNFIHPTSPIFPENWNGNTELYYPLVKNFCYTPATFVSLQKKVDELENKIANLNKIVEYHRSKLSFSEKIFYVKNFGEYKVWNLLGIKYKHKKRPLEQIRFIIKHLNMFH